MKTDSLYSKVLQTNKRVSMFSTQIGLDSCQNECDLNVAYFSQDYADQVINWCNPMAVF